MFSTLAVWSVWSENKKEDFRQRSFLLSWLQFFPWAASPPNCHKPLGWAPVGSELKWCSLVFLLSRWYPLLAHSIRFLLGCCRQHWHRAEYVQLSEQLWASVLNKRRCDTISSDLFHFPCPATPSPPSCLLGSLPQIVEGLNPYAHCVSLIKNYDDDWGNPGQNIFQKNKAEVRREKCLLFLHKIITYIFVLPEGSQAKFDR